jgi:hypothetical protein
MYYPSTGWMLFDTLTLSADPDIFNPPVILTSGNGWIYKPDEARTPQEIRRGLNKAWPRERVDYRVPDHHTEWHKAFIQNELDRRGWALPTKIEKPTRDSFYAGNHSFAIHWNSEPWGWQCISLDIREPSQYGHGDKNVILTYGAQSHPATSWYESRVVEDPYRGNGSYSYNMKFQDRDEVREAVRRWLVDPWGETSAHLKVNPHRLVEIMTPPIEKMGTVEYLDDDIDGVTDDLDFYGLYSGNAEFWTKGKIEQIMKSDVAWEALEKVIKVFEFTGYHLRVNTEYNYYSSSDSAITGLTIEIPDDPNSTKKARKKGHKITIDRSGISVSCGFVQDEKLWMDREKRMARDHMALLEEDLFTEFSIDLNDE